MIKALFLVAFLSASLVALPSIAFSQSSEPVISPAKKKIIAEMIVVTKVGEQAESTMTAIFDQLDASYPKLVEEMLKGRADLSEDDKKVVLDILVVKNQGAVKFRERLVKSINFVEHTEKVMYSLYDKFFTEGELADLVRFYKTPTGIKVNEVMPQLFAESMKITQEVLLPQIIDLTNKIAEEDIENAKKSTPEPSRQLH